MRERLLAGDSRLAARPQSDWGWVDVTSIRLIGAGGVPVDLTTRARFIAPDDGNAAAPGGINPNGLAHGHSVRVGHGHYRVAGMQQFQPAQRQQDYANNRSRSQ